MWARWPAASAIWRWHFPNWQGRIGLDGYSRHGFRSTLRVGDAPGRKLRVGWLVEPGFGPIDPEVAKTVEAAADALEATGVSGRACAHPALEHDFALEVFNRLHVMEMKPAFREATAGHTEDELYMMAKYMLSLPDTSMEDYIDAEQAVERLKDGFAA